jgi:phosphatidate phosphatase PAH1
MFRSKFNATVTEEIEDKCTKKAVQYIRTIELLLSCQRNGEFLDIIVIANLSELEIKKELKEYESSDERNNTPTWRDNWLQKIDSETYTNELMTPPPEFMEQLRLTNDVHNISFLANGELIKGKIYVWNYDSKIIISDIDGTITKSDMRGIMMTRLGYDYTHAGVSRLYNILHDNGYKLIYLTARSIVQHSDTKIYIESIIQEGKKLPCGPVITTPNKLWNALAREVIIKRPDSFKIAILNCIKSLFPNMSPFAAGFGNRRTDCASYTMVGIEPKHCYRINPRGQITVHATGEIFQGYYGLSSVITDRLPNLLQNIVHQVDHVVHKIIDYEGTDNVNQ